MDAREQLINEVMNALQGLENAVKKTVEDIFLICLNRYEVQERCTEITESGERRDYLNMYLATLRVEGKAPGTLEQYRLGKRAEVSKVHPHRYRRTLATNLINRGCNIQDVQQILGHANISTTQIYYVYNRDTVKAAYRKYAA